MPSTINIYTSNIYFNYTTTQISILNTTEIPEIMEGEQKGKTIQKMMMMMSTLQTGSL
mgnify:CR=1 FL=1